jgi:ArsR family transcriptional regulator, lead/cadmium/zinc/bismuth-responsive transcriptional repressor
MNKAIQKRAKEQAELFGVLSCESRLRILVCVAAKKKITVQDIAETLGMTHSAVSHQLGMLVAYRIVAYEKNGRFTHYAIAKTPQAKIATRLLAK